MEMFQNLLPCLIQRLKLLQSISDTWDGAWRKVGHRQRYDGSKLNNNVWFVMDNL